MIPVQLDLDRDQLCQLNGLYHVWFKIERADDTYESVLQFNTNLSFKLLSDGFHTLDMSYGTWNYSPNVNI